MKASAGRNLPNAIDAKIIQFVLMASFLSLLCKNPFSPISFIQQHIRRQSSSGLQS